MKCLFINERTNHDQIDRSHGDWEGWLAYFLEGIAVVADESIALIGSLFDVLSRDRTRYLHSRGATLAGARLFESLPRHPRGD
jgi:hypothetical protein